ncbi:MAG: asparagine synthase (glutamine-hydrolyzing) [Pseudomonadota bacterium]|nr:asparagine synthase (glutamine-hydrolyzing) [Pseudomonadota bacterium]
MNLEPLTFGFFMCGIAGILNLASNPPPQRRTLEKMIHTLYHRGPDGYGYFHNEKVGLAHARLSIIDLEGGWQPIYNEDKTIAIVFNGEIFNYPELRRELINRGHRFSTQSDTEVIVHLYEEKGKDCLDKLNGQFAMAIYDERHKSLFLARDRMGIRPLFYTIHGGRLYFSSEVKAIFAADPELPRAINTGVLQEIFTFWSPAANETIFSGVRQLGPGCRMIINADGGITEEQYWDIPFHPDAISNKGEKQLAEEIRELLIDAVRLRLRADVPVGAYLSGGLDSSAITSLIRHYTSNDLKTFSVTFADRVYDEQPQQQLMVDYLHTDHHEIRCDYPAIAAAFPDVIRHTETPILRTAPTPLYLLSSLVHDHHYKVVLTGEGADEILGGYDIFKEAKIRAFITRNPDSPMRAMLLKRLYPYLALSPAKSTAYARKFFDTDAPLDDPFYAHRPRWKTTSGIQRFLVDKISGREGPTPLEKLEDLWADKLNGLDYFSRAQFLESRLLMGNYLLSSQGDRMIMAHSVEGRFPFLDHRLVAFAGTIPPRLRMKALNEKNILKKAMADILPTDIVQRKKQPYMAPDILSFFGDREADYLDYYLSPARIKEVRLFKPEAVNALLSKCRKKSRQGFRENMALVGILSTQILYDTFIK